MEPIQKKMPAADTSHLARRQRFNMIKDVAASALVITAAGFALNFLPLSSGLAQEKKQDPMAQNGPYTLVRDIKLEFNWGGILHVHTTRLDGSDQKTSVRIPKKILQEITGKKNVWTVGPGDVVAKDMDDGIYAVFFKQGYVVMHLDKDKQPSFFHKKTASSILTGEIHEWGSGTLKGIFINGQYDEVVIATGGRVKAVQFTL